MKVDIKAFLKYGIVVEFLYILFVGTCYLQNSKYFCYCSQDKDNVALILIYGFNTHLSFLTYFLKESHTNN